MSFDYSFDVTGSGGPTGVEYAGELNDFLKQDLANVSPPTPRILRRLTDMLNVQWYPEVAHKIKITLIEALPNVLPMFSKQLMSVVATLTIETLV